MVLSAPTRPLTVALIGNPNTGKSTLFNALCGVRQRVGNYPGVTVEKKVGRASFAGRDFQIVDLPGSYSLAPRSPDEMIAVDVLLGRRGDVPQLDAVICIVDAGNLERNLYLVSQVLELGLPTVVALNMMDVAQEKGVRLDVDGLRQRLPVPIVRLQANRKIGLAELQAALASVVQRPVPVVPSPFPAAFQQEVAALQTLCTREDRPAMPRYLAERLLLDTSGYLTQAHLPGVDRRVLEQIDAARQRLAGVGLSVPAAEAVARYQWAGQLLQGLVERTPPEQASWSDRLDRLLTHRLAGTLAFALVMLVMFQSVYSVAEPASAAIDWLNGLAARWIAAVVPEGAWQSLLIHGLVEGVGGVLVFLPQILLLFLFIAILEDCGYMARAAYLMDKVMSRVGLSGKSFIPLLSSFACAIPGIMSARVIENPKDRLVTILIAPLMSCSARLPVYALLIGAFIPDHRYLGGLLGLRGLTMFGLYALGILTAVVVALLLRRTLIRGSAPPFIMELPSYRLPGPWLVLTRMAERGWDFVQRAGTLILAVTVLVWAAAYYPRDAGRLDDGLLARRDALQQRLAALHPGDASPSDLRQQAQLQSQLEATRRRIDGGYLRHSYLGRAGRLIEPLVRPLGWDWRVGCAVLASFPAREVVIATLAVIYNLGDEQDEGAETLGETLRGARREGSDQPAFTVPVALSLLVFFALCAQCASTLIIMRQETNSWRWPLFTFTYMTTLAYLGALLTYQLGTWIAS